MVFQISYSNLINYCIVHMHKNTSLIYTYMSGFALFYWIVIVCRRRIPTKDLVYSIDKQERAYHKIGATKLYEELLPWNQDIQTRISKTTHEVKSGCV